MIAWMWEWKSGEQVNVGEQFLRGKILIVGVGNLYRLFWNGCVKVGNEI